MVITLNTPNMFEILALPFFQRALLAGIILGLLMAVLGVIVVLRKMSFFSDAIGHSALTGIALGLLLGINPFWAAFAFAILVALLIAYTRAKSKLSLDTLLGVFFSASVALGVLLINLSTSYRGDLVSFLFGNILTITPTDVLASFIMTILVLAVLAIAGKKLIFIAFDSALAKAEGINVNFYETLLLILLAAVIALAIKFVGIILVTALLIIPAASAQNIARSLASMFALSALVSLAATLIGMTASIAVRAPSGPAIVLTAAVIFAITLFAKYWRSR
jgi:zinc transport system permease protein